MQADFDHIIDSNDNGGDDDGFGEEMKEFIGRALEILENAVARLPNAPINLESGDVALKFQLKVLEYMDSMNQELKCDKEERVR